MSKSVNIIDGNDLPEEIVPKNKNFIDIRNKLKEIITVEGR